MGVRTTVFECTACGDEWWERFEHLTKDELLDFLDDTCCPNCESASWFVTYTSQFAGGPVQPNPRDARGDRLRGFRCSECYTEFHEWIGEVSPDELRELIESLQCPDCDTDEWKMTDSYKFIAGDDPTAPIYYSVASEQSS